MSLFSSLSCSDEGAEAYGIIAAQLSTHCMNCMLHQTENNKNVDLLLSQHFIFLQTRKLCQSVARTLILLPPLPLYPFLSYSLFFLYIYIYISVWGITVLQYKKLKKRLLSPFSLHPFPFLFCYSVVLITMRRWWRSCWTEEPASTLRTTSCGRRCTPLLLVATQDWSRSSLHSKTCRCATPGTTPGFPVVIYRGDASPETKEHVRLSQKELSSIMSIHHLVTTLIMSDSA